MLKRGINADCLCVGLRIDQTGMAIASVAADTGAGARIVFVDTDSERHVKRFETGAFEIVGKMLNALLVAYRWKADKARSPKVRLDLHREYHAPDRDVQLRCSTAPVRRKLIGHAGENPP